MTEQKKRASWGSKLGFILSAAGSAVGLGNIWKFPGKAYEGGGGIYILIYIIVVLLMGVPVMLSELVIGRRAGTNAVSAFEKLDKRFAWVGWVGLAVAASVSCYYAHVGGWVLRYVFGYAVNPQPIFDNSSEYFYNMLGRSGDTSFFPWMIIGFAALFIAACAVILLGGVEKGIEKFNKVGMPALFLILIVLLVRTLTMSGSAEGVGYLLSFDWSKLTVETVLSALGQAFFSLSLGMAIMITYGSYLRKDENIGKSTLIICGMDTAVAILSAFIIVPAVFATLGSGSVGKGGSFAFVSLAGVFEQMPGGRWFGMLFYLLLFFAAITSCISLMESVVAFITERMGWRRVPTVIGLAAVMFTVGCLYTLTQVAYPQIKGIWADFVNGVYFPSFAEFMEIFPDRLLIPLTALGTAIFVGWFWRPKSAIEELEQNGRPFKWAALYSFVIRYVAPICIASILIAGFFGGMNLS